MSAYIHVDSAQETRRHVNRVASIVFALILAVTTLVLVVVVGLGLPSVLMFVLPFTLIGAWVVRAPILGFYLLFAASLLIPASPYPAPDAITDNLPFFSNLTDTASQTGFSISPAEILMLLILIGLVGSFAARRYVPAAGRLMVPYLIFGGAVLMGEINGLVHGGDFKLSLWELRPQAYGLAVFAMATFLLRDKSQLKVLLAILLVGEVLRAVTADYRYFITLSQDLGTLESVLAHEDSFLLTLFLIVLAMGLIWYRGPLTLLLAVLSPLVLTAIIVNHRRAGLLGLGLGIVTVMIAAYVVQPRLRGPLLRVAVVMAVLGIAFLAAFWNQQYGSIAEVVRPIKSLFYPSTRDLSSDLYRIAESANLKATFRTSPLIGIGFGHPYYVFYPQQGVSKYDSLWNVIPHNSVLWIPMRMGIVGMVSFFALISLAIVEAIWAMRTTTDKFMRATMIFALMVIFGELFNGYVDLGLENYRCMIVLGMVIAIINQAPRLAPGLSAELRISRVGRERPLGAYVPAPSTSPQPD